MSAVVHDDSPDPGRIFTVGFVLVVLATVGYSVAVGLIVSTLALLVAERLHFSATLVGVVLGASAVAALVARIFFGAWVDQHGARPFTMAGVVFVFVAALLFTWANQGPDAPAAATSVELGVLVMLASLILGVGISAYGTAAGTYVANAAPVHRRAEAAGYYGIGMTAGQGIGAGAGYSLAASYGFEALYAAAAAACLLACGLLAFLRELPTLRAGSARSAFGLERSVVPPAIGLFSMTFTSGTALALVPLLGAARGLPNPALYFLAFSIASIVGRLAGRLADRYGRLRIGIPAMLLPAIGQVVVAQASSTEYLVLAGACGGLGFAIAQPALQALAIDLTAPARRGAGVATFWAAADLGVMTGPTTAGFLLPLLSFGAVFLFAAAAPLLGAAVLLLGARGRARLSQ